jgi:hypothetical protein
MFHKQRDIPHQKIQAGKWVMEVMGEMVSSSPD